MFLPNGRSPDRGSQGSPWRTMSRSKKKVPKKEEIDRILELAASAGGKIERAGHDTFWGGYAGYFSAPDEYLWEIAWGAFPFLSDGALDIP